MRNVYRSCSISSARPRLMKVGPQEHLSPGLGLVTDDRQLSISQRHAGGLPPRLAVEGAQQVSGLPVVDRPERSHDGLHSRLEERFRQTDQPGEPRGPRSHRGAGRSTTSRSFRKERPARSRADSRPRSASPGDGATTRWDSEGWLALLNAWPAKTKTSNRSRFSRILSRVASSPLSRRESPKDGRAASSFVSAPGRVGKRRVEGSVDGGVGHQERREGAGASRGARLVRRLRPGARLGTLTRMFSWRRNLPPRRSNSAANGSLLSALSGIRSSARPSPSGPRRLRDEDLIQLRGQGFELGGLLPPLDLGQESLDQVLDLRLSHPPFERLRPCRRRRAR